MSRIVSIARTLPSAVALLLVTATARAESHAIGSHGAAFTSGRWERARLAPDVGKDQFRLVGGDVYLLVFELPALFDQRADFLAHLDLYAVNLERRAQQIEVDPEVGYQRYPQLTRATRWLDATVGGMKLAYQLDLISAGDGVGYLLLSWTSASGRQELRDALDELIDAFRLPAEGSEWFARSRPTAHHYDFGEWSVELTFADSVFSTDESAPRERYSLSADGGELAVHLLLDEIAGSADEALDEVVGWINDEEPYDELSRGDVALTAGRGRQALLRGRGDPAHEIAVAVVGLGRNRWVDLRMVTVGGHREALWQRLLDSLRAERVVELDAYPLVEATADSPPRYLTAAGRRLLAGSRWLADAGWSRAVEQRADGDLVVHQGNRLVAIGTGAAPHEKASDFATTVLYASDESFSGRLVLWGGEVLLVAAGAEVRKVADGALAPAGFRADAVAAGADGELLIARSGERRSLLGFGELPAVGATHLLLRDGASGVERSVVELADREVTGAALGVGRALVAARPREPSPGERASELSAAEPRRVELLLVDTTARTQRELQGWRRVDRIAPGPWGWLVSGVAPDGEVGVFVLRDDDSRELLLSGPQLGLALDPRGLTFVAEGCPTDGEEAGRNCVYRAPLDLVREHGPQLWPFAAARLAGVAADLRARAGGDATSGLLPASRDELAALLAVAQQSARELLGAELPVSGPGVDALLAGLYGEELDADTVELLALLLAEAFLAEGATWVAPGDGAPGSPPTGGWVAENALAVAVHPLAVLRSTLSDDEDSWHHPVASISSLAAGRSVLLGHHAASLRERLSAEQEELAGLLHEDAAAPLTRALDARRRNHYLRDHVYRRLAAHGRQQVLATVAGAFAGAEDAAPIDHVALAAVRLAGSLGATQAEELIAGLRAAITRAPEEAALYLLLGAAYERSARPDRERYALVCYEKAQAIERWGATGTAAGEAIARLGDAQ